ncbi:MAG: rRNA cytosine-C5-methyltransferase [Tannerellaceae bacterium]|jgi:16S rRNA C967 or C1407 C5-methylase (RsmB/RsmF family)/NOL1/NOP2/fmu family ribosome biogenesis protein|nr:rRNA cytosine-C5-methyltransferase [Tannerellaceae bacterium]
MILPSHFIARTKALTGEAFPLLESALQTDSPVSIRINRSKGITALQADPVLWCDSGYYLPCRLPFTFDPLSHAGGYYVQEASSMFLEQAVRAHVQSPVTCLDLCAAPGGKSTHLLDMLPEGSLLVSNEIIRSRSHILAENITKWGNPSVIVTQNSPLEAGQLTHMFDVIVADVPCSGEGMFRKDPNSIHEWSIDNVTLCAARQRRIVHDVWNALKPGGLLIYSTCTYNTEENEETVSYILHTLGAEALPIPVREKWQITGALEKDDPAYRFFPHKTKGEGFFLAVVRKDGKGRHENSHTPANRKEKRNPLPAAVIPHDIRCWLHYPETYHFELQGETIRAFPRLHDDAYRQIALRLRVVMAGISLGKMKGKEVCPSHALAMSVVLNRKAFPSYDLNREEAIRYLRKEAVVLPKEVGKGYVPVTYNDFPLGFVKQLGERANNLYPQEWRIRSGYLPTDSRELLSFLYAE